MPDLQAEYVGEVDVQLPGSDEPATLHVWRNPVTRKLVAIDNMELDATRNWIPDPYDPETRLHFHDTFSGLPK